VAVGFALRHRHGYGLIVKLEAYQRAGSSRLTGRRVS
jgi:hypothetical protein